MAGFTQGDWRKTWAHKGKAEEREEKSARERLLMWYSLQAAPLINSTHLPPPAVSVLWVYRFKMVTVGSILHLFFVFALNKHLLSRFVMALVPKSGLTRGTVTVDICVYLPPQNGAVVIEHVKSTSSLFKEQLHWKNTTKRRWKSLTGVKPNLRVLIKKKKASTGGRAWRMGPDTPTHTVLKVLAVWQMSPGGEDQTVLQSVCGRGGAKWTAVDTWNTTSRSQ